MSYNHNNLKDTENNKNVIYSCPMHPEIKSKQQGICPKCGMTLVLVDSSGSNTESKGVENRHKGHTTSSFLNKFLVCLVLTIPIVLYSEALMNLVGISMPQFLGSKYITFIFGSIVFFYGGWVFIVGALREIKSRLPGMMTLISVAITSAYLWSIYATITNGESLFWELTTLITIMLLGHFLEMRAVSSTQGALGELSKLLPDTADIVRGEIIETITLIELKEGDIVLVRPGANVPADGIIIDGNSNVNESMITGESLPVSKKINDSVIAGTINGDGVLKVRVSSIGENTFLAGVMRLVKEAQISKSRLQILSDRAAYILTVIAIAGALLTLISWFIVGVGLPLAVARMVSVLVIACPHALGLAVPLVASISTTKAAKNGFLVKQRLSLEEARLVDVVMFDKTGTLTNGNFEVVEIWSVDGRTDVDVLHLAASVDILSEHPIANAVVKSAKQRNIALDKVKNFEALKGLGVKAMVGSSDVLIGGLALLRNININIPDSLAIQESMASKKGQTVIFVLENKVVIGGMALADTVRAESRDAISMLHYMGIRTAMITGDSNEVAASVSNELGMDEYFARILPSQKSEKVKELQSRGLKVAMVGDGINDAPALTQADVGIAIGAGTNVAIESAGIILVRNDPRDIVKIINLSKMTYSKMIQNIWWATGYNIIAMPLAAGVLAYKGFVLSPAISAMLMSMSTIIVALNAMSLRKSKL